MLLVVLGSCHSNVLLLFCPLGGGFGVRGSFAVGSFLSGTALDTRISTIPSSLSNDRDNYIQTVELLQNLPFHLYTAPHVIFSSSDPLRNQTHITNVDLSSAPTPLSSWSDIARSLTWSDGTSPRLSRTLMGSASLRKALLTAKLWSRARVKDVLPIGR